MVFLALINFGGDGVMVDGSQDQLPDTGQSAQLSVVLTVPTHLPHPTRRPIRCFANGRPIRLFRGSIKKKTWQTTLSDPSSCCHALYFFFFFALLPKIKGWKREKLIRSVPLFYIYSKDRSPSPSPSTAYLTHQSRRSLTQEPQDVSPIHVNFVKDTSRYWYKPNIAREDGIIYKLLKLFWTHF